MDKLDKLSICAIVVFAVWALCLVIWQDTTGSAGENGKRAAQAEVKRYLDPNLDKKISEIQSQRAGWILNAHSMLATARDCALI